VQVRTLAESIEAIGLGSWRLKGRMSEPFEVLAAVIEGTWRQAFDMQLSLHDLPEASSCSCSPAGGNDVAWSARMTFEHCQPTAHSIALFPSVRQKEILCHTFLLFNSNTA